MLIKSTAILSVVGITELTRQGEVFIITFPAKSLFIYAMIAAIYFLYCYPLLRWPTGWKAAGRRPARRQPQLERTPPSTMPTEYVDTYYKRTLSDPQPAIRPWPARKAPRSAWWAAAWPACRSRWNWPGAAGRSRCWKAAASPGRLGPQRRLGLARVLGRRRRHPPPCGRGSLPRALPAVDGGRGDHPRQHPRPGHPRRPQGRRPPARGALRRRRRAAALVR